MQNSYFSKCVCATAHIDSCQFLQLLYVLPTRCLKTQKYQWTEVENLKYVEVSRTQIKNYLANIALFITWLATMTVSTTISIPVQKKRNSKKLFSMQIFSSLSEKINIQPFQRYLPSIQGRESDGQRCTDSPSAETCPRSPCGTWPDGSACGYAESGAPCCRGRRSSLLERCTPKNWPWLKVFEFFFYTYKDKKVTASWYLRFR